MQIVVSMRTKQFLSTPPSRVATNETARRETANKSFYPRHPRGWRRAEPDCPAACKRVSIHATLAGGDGFFGAFGVSDKGFYPRHPRGWRQYADRARSGKTEFLSTPPSRVATAAFNVFIPQGHVSIHATLAGGDPRRQRQQGQHGSVSIHATLAGGDLKPGGGISLSNVSIHATLAGGDPACQIQRPDHLQAFLSTPPSRVATAKVYKNVQCLLRKREKIICKIKNNLKHPPHIPIATSKKCTACPKTSDGIGAKLLGKVCLLSPRTGAATQAAHHPEQIRGGGQGAPRGFCSGCQAGKSAGCRFRGQSARPARL